MSEEFEPDVTELREAAIRLYEKFMRQPDYLPAHDHFRSKVRTNIFVEIAVGPDDEPIVRFTHRDPESAKNGLGWVQLGRVDTQCQLVDEVKDR